MRYHFYLSLLGALCISSGAGAQLSQPLLGNMLDYSGSNFGHFEQISVYSWTDQWSFAVQFETGPNSRWDLRSFTARARSQGASFPGARDVAWICADEHGTPGAQISESAYLPIGGPNRDWSFAGVLLDPSTRYWIVVSTEGTFTWYGMNTGPATFPRERNGSGWSQGNRMVYRGSGGWTNWPWSSNSIAWNWDYEFYGIALPVPDGDHDGVPDARDNCPTVFNPDQADCNHDGVGDACEIAAGAPDINHNGIPDSCECLGDIYLDQRVDGGDLGPLLAYWGPVINSAASRACDLNVDGRVDGFDLGVLLNSWGPCSN